MPEDCSTAALAAIASWLAWRALSALCLTVLVSSSMDAAVSSSELACSSVRDDSSWLPAAIWALAVPTESTPKRTSETTRTRRSRMRCIAASSWAISSRPSTTIVRVRSPSAIAFDASTACCSDRVMVLASMMPKAMANPVPSSMAVPARVRKTPYRAVAASNSFLASVNCSSISASTPSPTGL